MKKRQWHTLFAKTHKWIGLILGVQLVFWTVGGLVMTWIPIDTVRGQHKVAPQTEFIFSNKQNFISISALLKKAGNSAKQIEFRNFLGNPVIYLELNNGQRQLRDAQTGNLISPIGADLAQQVALADFALNAKIKRVVEISEKSVDYRGPLPVWQVTFDDKENSAIYVSPVEGKVVARRSSIWRFYDFFWMLHIMDYNERHDTNNWLVIITSLFAVLFSISGIGLLFFRFYRRDFNFLLGEKKRI
ncbi:PepSY domain-containing protein [Kordiimonas laminariae]|uniref:PepSY domain-containing protein n=1 Tax=Kordiimonas laminariae TaxID=2917717 RepID=UPI001FF433D5|nr:PepSY domain-containing protein [Kordiimonas laminariae]MCK0071104.1 PepSY domain-containing protein [Kordiimonas laminariae]